MYPNWVFSMFAAFGFLCCAIPLPWHLEAWNTGTCLYMIWVGLGCLIHFINSIIWYNDALNIAPVWCDITTRIIIGISWAIPAASLCINRRLYHIASVQSVTVSKAEKRRAIMVDLAIALGLPMLGMVLYYIPQGHRFDIIENIGCVPYVYITPVGLGLIYVPPLLFGAVSAVYCVLSIRNFWKRHNQFAQLLSKHNNLTSSRYLRLIALAGTDLVFTIPGAIFVIVMACKRGIQPWLGWDDTHYGFSRVDQLPAAVWRGNLTLEVCFELSRWALVICAFIFFGFFGFADEALKNYKSAASTVAKKIGYTGSFTLTNSTNGTMSKSGATDSIGKIRPIPPIEVHGEMLSRHRSIDSFTNVSVDFNDEKERGFSPTASYGAFTLSDVGGTLADVNSPSSSASSIKELPATANNDQAPSITLTVPTPRLQSDLSPV